LVGDAPTLDARTVFRDWLRAKSGPGAAANSTGLDAAMQRLLTGAIPFTPHIALEDAIATAAVLMAVVQRGGVM
jgi:DNA polymerase III epsilon subunit-like protein